MEKICQIGVIVKDIEQKVKHWAQVLDSPVPDIHTIEGYEKTGAVYKGNPTSARARQAIFNLGDISIELLEPTSGPSAWDDFAKTNGQGIHHIAFVVENTDKELEVCRRENMNVLQQGHWPTGRYTYIDTFKKLGAAIELLEFYPKAE